MDTLGNAAVLKVWVHVLRGVPMHTVAHPMWDEGMSTYFSARKAANAESYRTNQHVLSTGTWNVHKPVQLQEYMPEPQWC